MRYVSPETRLVGPEEAFDYTLSAPAQLWERARESMGEGRLWSAVIVLLLTIAIARSTSTVDWVTGIDIVTWVALAGAVLLGVLALTPLRDPIPLGIGLVLAPVVAFWAAWPQLHASHPTDTISVQLANVWWQRINDGSAAQEPAFYLVLISLLMWVTG